MTPEQIHQAAQTIFEMRATMVANKAQANSTQRKFIRRQIEAHHWRRMLAALMAETGVAQFE
jgi:hypothetical protein